MATKNEIRSRCKASAFIGLLYKLLEGVASWRKAREESIATKNFSQKLALIGDVSTGRSARMNNIGGLKEWLKISFIYRILIILNKYCSQPAFPGDWYADHRTIHGVACRNGVFKP